MYTVPNKLTLVAFSAFFARLLKRGLIKDMLGTKRKEACTDFVPY